MDKQMPPIATQDIQVINVKKYFKEVKAVDGIDLEIQTGEFVALLGPNGAGKTTLVEMIEGIQKPDAGEILIRGQHWKNNQDILHRILGISLQENYFFDKLTVLETLTLFASFYGLRGQRISGMLELTGLQEKRKEYVKNLSGGQRQKLALGIALLNDAQILLLDEPTRGMDWPEKEALASFLRRLTAEGRTVVIATHDVELVARCADRVIVLEAGRVIADDAVGKVMQQEPLFASQMVRLFGNPRMVTVDDVLKAMR